MVIAWLIFYKYKYQACMTFTDKRTDSCIYTQIFSPKKNWLFSLFRGQKKIYKKVIMQLFSANSVFKKKKSFLTPKK